MLNRNKTSQYADQASASAHRAVDTARDYAAQALERTSERMRDLRYGMADRASAAQRQAGVYADATTRYVAEQPVKAALMAAAFGALLMAAVTLSRRRRDHY